MLKVSKMTFSVNFVTFKAFFSGFRPIIFTSFSYYFITSDKIHNKRNQNL